MSAVASTLNELSRLSHSLGEDALGREANAIEQMFHQRSKAMVLMSRQAGKSLLSKKLQQRD